MSPKSVDEIIISLPRAEQVLMKRLRSLILECLPKAEEKVSYSVPFYRRNRMICFIWPPSIFWGPNRTLETQQAKGVGLLSLQSRAELLGGQLIVDTQPGHGTSFEIEIPLVP